MGIKWPGCGIGHLPLVVLMLMGNPLCAFMEYYRVNFNILLLLHFCVVLSLYYLILPHFFSLDISLVNITSLVEAFFLIILKYGL
jgi:hypothetical protein